MEARRKLKLMRVFTDFKGYDYEPPNMYYEKATGEIKMREDDGKKKAQKKIIRNMDEYE